MFVDETKKKKRGQATKERKATKTGDVHFLYDISHRRSGTKKNTMIPVSAVWRNVYLRRILSVALVNVVRYIFLVRNGSGKFAQNIWPCFTHQPRSERSKKSKYPQWVQGFRSFQNSLCPKGNLPTVFRLWRFFRESPRVGQDEMFDAGKQLKKFSILH